MREWLVAADDRTGAFEVAALLTAVVGPITVSVGRAPDGSGVVDLGSRAATVVAAGDRARSVDDTPSRWTAHKIDSTLRGHWAAELSARRAATGRRLVLLPGWPEMGRTCVGGQVLVHGEPIGSPLDALPGAALLADADALRAWLRGSGSMAVCDVPDAVSLSDLARELAEADVLLAGPAGPLGAVFAARLGTRPNVPTPSIAGTAMVVCGSANAVSREQILRLAAARPDIEIVSAPAAQGPLHAEVAADLAARARGRFESCAPDNLVIIGGDTAAAFLGDAPRRVGGFAATGMPWSRAADDSGPLVITKAGGFGDADALVRLLAEAR